MLIGIIVFYIIMDIFILQGETHQIRMHYTGI